MYAMWFCRGTSRLLPPRVIVAGKGAPWITALLRMVYRCGAFPARLVPCIACIWSIICSIIICIMSRRSCIH